MAMTKRALLAALSTGAAIAAMSAGEAKAAFCTFNNPSSCNATYGNWQVSGFTLNTVNGAPLSVADKFAQFASTPTSFEAYFGFVGPASTGIWGQGSISFTLTYSGTLPINSFSGNTTGVPPSGIGSPIMTLSGAPNLSPITLAGSPVTQSFNTPLGYSVNLTYSYNFAGSSNGTRIQSVTSTFEAVPGPLPILGGGIAFGFSRRLRRRIQASKVSSQA